MRLRRAVVASLVSALLAWPARAGDEEDLLRELERMGATAQGGAASPAELRALVSEMLPRVARVMRHAPPSRLDVRVVSREEARTRLLAVLQRDYPGDALDRLSLALAAVGLVEAGTDLRAEAQALYGSNVSGFYDPHEHALFLLNDQPLAAQSLVVSHELAHAIQDEILPLDAASRKVRASEDGQLALSAAIEGQAQEVASLVMAEDVAELGEGGGDLAALLSESTAASAEMAGAQASVPWLGLQLRFPYTAGAGLVAAVRTKEDPSAAALLRRPPASTAQVIDPALYRSDERPREAKLDLASRFPGSTPVYATTLGAANVDFLGELHALGNLGAGWRGDRMEAIRVAGRVIAVWAVAFREAAQGDRLVRAWRTAGRDRGWAAQQTGNVAVLLVDVPSERVAEVARASASAFR
ncbi:MAG TPA: DUF6782 family putative metallopeptidase [Myxococcaceae bacterium]|nr:DUF6782 family putative metallopeptidase [Myxococcaceae bacterium]